MAEHPVLDQGVARDADAMRTPGSFSPAVAATLNQFAAMYSFPLDDFQREAAGALLENESVMVAAPTGTGKTIVAEFGIWDAFRGQGKVFYTTPIKALSNQKYRDLRTVYGDQVGLLTGDVSENRDARVIVMTTEILRNMLLQTPWDLDDVECIIFDEIHYLADPERGTTWEESLILCPDHIKLICLSATVNNADEIAAWISRTHRPIRLITHYERAVPLALHYFVDGKMHLAVDHTGVLVRDFPHTGGELRRQANRGGNRRRQSERAAPGMDEPQPFEIIDALAKNDLLPAIYFLFSRNDCQQFASRLAMLRPNMISPVQSRLIDQTVNAVLAGLRPEDRELEQVKLITLLARKGIGFHHAGLLPILKQLVEVLFTRGLMEVVFATDTLALGVNMPARTVVVGRMSKWDGRRRRMLIPNEFQQMAGRAGRRGLDKFGHVVVPYTPWFTFKETLQIAIGELHPVRSAFAVRYNTVLNLWDPPRGDRVRAMLQQSLDQFQSSQRIRDIEADIVDLGAEIDALPTEGFAERIEQLAEYDRLVSSINAARDLVRRLETDLASGEQRLALASPWPEPGRQALRRVFRTATPGLVAHARDNGWIVYLGRDDQNGIGLFLFPKGIRQLAEYRQLDYLTAHVVPLPPVLGDPSGDLAKLLESVGPEKLDAVWQAVRDLELPDLAAEAAAHRAREMERFATERVSLEARLEEARQSLTELQAARAAHPFFASDARKVLRGLVSHADDLERQRNGLQEKLERELDAEDERIRGVIRGIRNVLHRFGYLHRGFPTEKADMLAEVFDNDGLILCEMVDRGVLDHLEPADVAELFSWFSFDREYRYGNGFVLPDQLTRVRRMVADVEHAVLGEERAEGLVISEGHNPNFYGAARAWANGSTMIEIGEKLELSEGDLVLTFNKTIDLMRQVRDMLTNVQQHQGLRETLFAAERLLKRDIVEQSLAIGFAPIEIPDTFESELPEPEAPPTKPRNRRTRTAPGDESPVSVSVPLADVSAEPARANKRGKRSAGDALDAPTITEPPRPPVKRRAKSVSELVAPAENAVQMVGNRETTTEKPRGRKSGASRKLEASTASDEAPASAPAAETSVRSRKPRQPKPDASVPAPAGGETESPRTNGRRKGKSAAQPAAETESKT